MKVIVNKYIPFGNFLAVNLFGVLFAKRPVDNFTINHELIHTAQMKELLYIPFYILYGLEWCWKLYIYRDGRKAYRNLSYEREAYTHERDLSYLYHRRHFKNFKYLTK